MIVPWHHLVNDRLVSQPEISFSALIRGDPLRIYGKALQFLKLESSEHPTVKIL